MEGQIRESEGFHSRFSFCNVMKPILHAQCPPSTLPHSLTLEAEPPRPVGPSLALYLIFPF